MALNFIKNAITRLRVVKVPYRTLITISNTPIKVNIPVIPTLATNLQNHWIYKEDSAIKLPINNVIPLSIPNQQWWVPPLEEPTVSKSIEDPKIDKVKEKQAARLIVIRRKKMKKHKLRKLRKKMKYEWAKVRQRRELKKEKLFQGELIAQCKKAENFSAEAYVQERLERLNEFLIPKRWKGRRLPEFIIRQKLGLPPK